MADRIRHVVCDAPISIPNSEITVTMSFGAAMYESGHIKDKEALIHIADVALYAAKNSGRNRVVVADSSDAPTA